MNNIKIELSKVGVLVNDIYDLVNTKQSYSKAIPVLINLLENGIKDISIKEGVIRALAVKEAIGKATPVLIKEYNQTPKDNIGLRWAIGNTIYTTIIEDEVENIFPIIEDKKNGISRQMFVAALGKAHSNKAEDLLIKLLSDEEVVLHALDALGRMKSQKAKDKILLLTKHPKKIIKKEAEKALKNIIK